jgi:hypothetical protein
MYIHITSDSMLSQIKLDSSLHIFRPEYCKYFLPLHAFYTYANFVFFHLITLTDNSNRKQRS